MLTTTNDSRSSWDIFSSTSDGLRELTLLASQLAEDASRKVRVFLHHPAALGEVHHKIDSTLWVQPVLNYELWRTRLAEVVAPAANVLSISGQAPPPLYLERMAYGAGNRRKLIRLWRLGEASPTQDLTIAKGDTEFMTLDMTQSTTAGGMGVVKASRSTAEMRRRWRSQENLVGTTLDSLGLKELWSKDSVVTFIWGRITNAPHQAARALEKACGRPQLIIIAEDIQSLTEANQQRTGLVANTIEVRAVHSANGSVISKSIPQLRWPQIDELVWSSDLVVCNQRDIAHRAMEAGTPMIWHHPGDSLLNWYLDPVDPHTRQRILAAVHQLQISQESLSGLLWLVVNRDILAPIAQHVERRISLAPKLVESLNNFTSFLQRETKRLSHESSMSSHVNTRPMELD